jgi:hypothetical protein
MCRRGHLAARAERFLYGAATDTLLGTVAIDRGPLYGGRSVLSVVFTDRAHPATETRLVMTTIRTTAAKAATAMEAKAHRIILAIQAAATKTRTTTSRGTGRPGESSIFLIRDGLSMTL